MSIPESFGSRVARLVKERGVAAAALSRELGRNPTYIRDVTTGRSRAPRGDSLDRLARALGITMQELIAGTDLEDPAAAATRKAEGPPGPGVADKGEVTWGAPRSIDVERIAGATEAREFIEAKQDLPSFFILQGDLLMIDPKETPSPNQLVVVNMLDQDGSARTVIRRHLPPYLVAHNRGRPEFFDPDTMSVMATVTAVIRKLP